MATTTTIGEEDSHETKSISLLGGNLGIEDSGSKRLPIQSESVSNLEIGAERYHEWNERGIEQALGRNPTHLLIMKNGERLMPRPTAERVDPANTCAPRRTSGTSPAGAGSGARSEQV